MCRLPEVYAAWSGFIFLAEQKCATSSGSVLHVLHKPLMFIADHKYESPFRVHLAISSWGGGGKLTDHVAIRPRRGEGRLHIYNIGNVLGGRGGGGGGGGEGGKLGQFGS